MHVSRVFGRVMVSEAMMGMEVFRFLIYVKAGRLGGYRLCVCDQGLAELAWAGWAGFWAHCLHPPTCHPTVVLS